MMSGMESTHNDLKVYLGFNEFDPGKEPVQPHISGVYIFLLSPPPWEGAETCKIYLFFKLLKWGKI